MVVIVWLMEAEPRFLHILSRWRVIYFVMIMLVSERLLFLCILFIHFGRRGEGGMMKFVRIDLFSNVSGL